MRFDLQTSYCVHQSNLLKFKDFTTTEGILKEARAGQFKNHFLETS
jgi:hypothetical protein